MRTWDLLGGVEVDIMECDAPPTSVAFSPEGAFVATTHVGEIGVTLWVNKIHFGVETIGTASSAERNVIDTAAAPITDELVTLSTVPVAQWNVLANLDLVRLRNKPKQPIAKPKAAPFFLPTVKSLNPVFDVEDSAVTGQSIFPFSLLRQNSLSLEPFSRLSKPYVVLRRSPQIWMWTIITAVSF